MDGKEEQYQPESTAQYFDAYAEKEWDRLTATPFQEVSLHVHTHYLRKHIQPDWRVLEIGAGPGRFTQLLAELGARVVVSDLSPVQVALNRQFATRLGFATAVEDWRQVDVSDLSDFPDGSFDAVLAYGGPFSYVLDRRNTALAECRRVLRPGGKLLLSVMSLWGTMHRFLQGVLDVPEAYNRRIVSTGDLTPATNPQRSGHFMHLFHAGELREFLAGGGFDVLEMSASACLSIHWDDYLVTIRQDSQLWQELLWMELQATAAPGSWNMGSHLLSIAQLSGA